MTIAEKVSYIKGLAEGMKIDDSTNEGKITLAMLDVLNDIALTLEDIDSDMDDVADIVSDIEESIYDLEDEVYGEEECDCCDDDDDMYEITCPSCENTVTVDFEEISDGTFTCPNCGNVTKFDTSVFDDEECDCGCDHE